MKSFFLSALSYAQAYCLQKSFVSRCGTYHCISKLAPERFSYAYGNSQIHEVELHRRMQNRECTFNENQSLKCVIAKYASLSTYFFIKQERIKPVRQHRGVLRYIQPINQWITGWVNPSNPYPGPPLPGSVLTRSSRFRVVRFRLIVVTRADREPC